MNTNTPIPAFAVERSGDRKLSVDRTISATWVSQGSCPDSCSFKGSGCYAETGRSAIHTRRLNNAQAEGNYTPEEIAEYEAKAIRGLSGKFDLRAHIVGDCKTVKAAKIVADALNEYKVRSGKRVWTYTHAENVPREVWGDISILRSCESVSELNREHNRGYACALVVPEAHESHKPVKLEGGFTGIPCPYQVKKTASCKDCGLCLNDKHLRAKKLVILFAPDHGTSKRVKTALKVLPVVSESACGKVSITA